MLNGVFSKEDPLIHILKDVKRIYETQKFERFIWVGKNVWLGKNCEVFSFIDVKVDVILDNDNKKWDDFSQIPVKPVDYAQEVKDDVIFVISNRFGEALYNQLMEMGINGGKIFLLPSHDEYKEKLKKKIKIDSNYRKLSLNELQKIELQILIEFKNKCNEWGLNYFLAGGTLLGAIRHQGFIPWDDDIDVYMPYEDYLKFIDLYEDNDDYALLDWRKIPEYDFQFAKLTKKDTFMFHPKGINMGVYIDIFPLAGYPSNQSEIENKWNLNRILDGEWTRYFLRKEFDLECEDCRQKVMDCKYNYSFYDADMIGTMQNFLQKPWVSPKEAFSQSIEKSFEGEKFLVPIGYDSHLRYRYGEYMQLPPKEQQVFHGYPVYIKN